MAVVFGLLGQLGVTKQYYLRQLLPERLDCRVQQRNDAGGCVGEGALEAVHSCERLHGTVLLILGSCMYVTRGFTK